jgi:hypothetical protein
VSIVKAAIWHAIGDSRFDDVPELNIDHSLGYRVCRDGLGRMAPRRMTIGSNRFCEE